MLQAAVLRRWRRDPRSSCGAGWSPFIWLLERIGASSARPVGLEYLAPYHMKVGGCGRGKQAQMHHRMRGPKGVGLSR